MERERGQEIVMEKGSEDKENEEGKETEKEWKKQDSWQEEMKEELTLISLSEM